MNNISLALPALYFFIILALSTYLLIRGITHTFVCLFAAAAVIELIRSMAFLLMSLAPGGFSANARYSARHLGHRIFRDAGLYRGFRFSHHLSAPRAASSGMKLWPC